MKFITCLAFLMTGAVAGVLPPMNGTQSLESLRTCSSITPTTSSHLHHSLCTMPFHPLEDSPNAHKRSIPLRQQAERIILTDEAGLTVWCRKHGWQPRQTETVGLCKQIPSRWAIPRAVRITPEVASDLPDRELEIEHCICSQWSLGGASFRACNCDRCDSLNVQGLEETCAHLNSLCSANGHASGYEYESGVNAISILNGFTLIAGYHYDQLDEEFLFARVKSICRSGNENRLDQNYEGSI